MLIKCDTITNTEKSEAPITGGQDPIKTDQIGRFNPIFLGLWIDWIELNPFLKNRKY